MNNKWNVLFSIAFETLQPPVYIYILPPVSLLYFQTWKIRKAEKNFTSVEIISKINAYLEDGGRSVLSWKSTILRQKYLR